MLDGSGLIHVVTTCSLIVLSVLLQHQSVQVLVSHRQWAILEHRLMNQKRGPQNFWADCAWFNRFTTFRLLECQDCRIFITWNRPSCGGYNPDHLVIDYHQYCKILPYWWCHISKAEGYIPIISLYFYVLVWICILSLEIPYVWCTSPKHPWIDGYISPWWSCWS